MSSLPPNFNKILLQAGIMAGILKGPADHPTFNSQWFSDPLTNLEKITGGDLEKLLEALFGALSGAGVGAAVNTLHREWFPIPIPKKGGGFEDLGLYLVAYTDPQKNTIWGPGFLKEIVEGSVTIAPFVILPIVEMPAQGGKPKAVLGQPKYPIEMGVEIVGSNGIFSSGKGINSVSFDGVQASVNFDFSEVPKLELVLQNLKLPGEKKGSDRSLEQLIADVPISEWIETAFSILGNQLSKLNNSFAKNIGDIIQSILHGIGINSDLPAIDWEALPTKGINIFKDWLRAVVKSPKVFEEWLNNWAGIFSNTEKFAGIGTPTQPFKIPIHKSTEVGTLYFTVAISSAGKNAYNIYPGFELDSISFNPIPSLKDKFQVFIQADLDLFELTLPATDDAKIPFGLNQFFPMLEVMIAANNPNSTGLPQPPPLVSIGTAGTSEYLEIGAVRGGLSYSDLGAKGGIRHLHPTFELLGANIMGGTFPIINLLNFKKDVQIAKQAISKLVKVELNKIAQLSPLAGSLATILGLIEPASFKNNGKWTPTLLIDEIDNLIEHPLKAWGYYFSQCLTQKDKQGNYLFPYLMPDFATLLHGTGSTLNHKGGTVDDPWQIELFSPGDKVAVNLEAWQGKKAGEELAIGLGVLVPFSIGPLEFNFELSANLLELQLPTSIDSGSFGGFWLPGVDAVLRLPGFNQPPLSYKISSSIDVSIDDIELTAGWHRTRDLYFDAIIDGLNIDKQSFPKIVLGTDTVDWETELGKLAEAVVLLMGIELTLYGGKGGATVAALLGMFPEGFSQGANQGWTPPKGITFPASWPKIDLSDPSTFFTSPWQDFRTQISQVFGKGDVAIPLMQLIGWTLTGKVPTAPAKVAAGSASDPWMVKFESGLEPFIFKGTNEVGFGLQYQFENWTTKELSIDTNLTLSGFSIGTTKTFDYGFDPELGLSCSFTNPTGKQKPLISGSANSLQIGWATLGFSFDKKGVAIPVLKLFNSGINTKSIKPIIELSLDPHAVGSYISAQGLQLLESLLNGLMEHLSAQLQTQKIPGLQAFLNILDLFGILQTQVPTDKQTNPIYSFNPTSWTALLANPLNFLIKQSEQVLSSPTGTTKLYSNLLTLIGKPNFVIPPAVEGILIFFEVLGLIEKKKQAYYVNFAQWMSLINHPLQFLEGLPLAAEKNILNDKALQKQLTAALSHLPKPQNKYGLQLSLLTGNKIRFGVPEDSPLQLGGGLGLNIGLVFDLKNDALSIDLSLSESAIGLEVLLAGGLDFANGANALTWSVGMQSIVPPGVTPAEITLYSNGHNGSKIDIKALVLQVPVFIISTAAVTAINNLLLPKSPLFQNIITALGLALPVKQKGDPVVMGSISSILLHPASWLMHILGDGNGKIDLTKVGNILHELPGAAGITGPGGIKFTPFQEYGFELAVGGWGDIKLSSNDVMGVTIGLDAFPPIPTNKLLKRVAISPVLNFGADGGIHVSGDLSVTLQLEDNKSPATPNPNEKSLTTHFSYHKSIFGLSLFGVWKGTDFGPVNILPFHGLSQFLEQSFISTVKPILIKKLQNGPAIGQHLAAVFGIIPPTGTNVPTTWPLVANHGMLLSASQLGGLIHNPLAALGGYYTRTLNTTIAQGGNKVSLFPYMLENFAAIFKGAGTTFNPSGGTEFNPWEIVLYQPGDDISLTLQAWRPTGSLQELIFALGVSIPVSKKVGSQTLELNPALQVQILHLELPNAHNNGAFDAHWVPAVNSQIKLSEKSGALQLPGLVPLGINAELADLNFLFGWKAGEGAHFDAVIDKLIVNKGKFPTLVFGTDTVDWKSELESLGIIVLNIMGANLVSHAGNTGIILAAAFGLVEDMPAVFKNTKIWTPPTGITFPATWPHFTTKFPEDFFTNPWVYIRSQLYEVFSQQPYVIPIVQLFFWNFSGKVPATSGKGTIADPWIIDLPGSLGLVMEIWLDDNKAVQFGIGKKINTQTAGILNLETNIILEGIGLNKNSSSLDPFVDLHLMLTNAKGSGTPLYTDATTGLTLGAVNLGVSFGIKGISPILGILQSKLTTAGKLEDYFLTPTDIANSFGSVEGLHLLEALLNELIVFLSEQANKGTNKSALALMNIGAQLGILNVDSASNYSLNTSNWENMLSDPPAYFLTAIEHIFLTPDVFNKVITDINVLTSLSIPTFPKGIEDLLFAFGFMDLAHTSATTTTLVFNPSKLMELIHHPANYLNHQAGQILNNKAVINHLIAALKPVISKLPKWITIPEISNKEIDIQLKIVIHKLIDLEANLILDFASNSMTAEASLGIEGFASALVFSDTYHIGNGTADNHWALSISQLSHNLPQPVGQITLISDQQLVPDIIQIIEEIPLQLLASFLRYGLNEHLFPNSQLAINIFKGLGLFEGKNLGPLYPVIAHPLQWLQSEFELKGGVNWKNIGTLLFSIPGSKGFHTPTKKVSLIQYKTDGLEIKVAEWGNIALSSNAASGINLIPTFKPTAAPEITISADLAYEKSLAFSGSAIFNFKLDPTTAIGVEVDYDNGTFAVDLDGLLPKSEKFPLFPFTSFAKVVGSAAGTKAILNAVMEVVDAAFNKFATKYPNSKLTIFIQDLVKVVNSFQITSLNELYATLDKLIKDPTNWISTWFTTKITTTITDLKKVIGILALTKYFPPPAPPLPANPNVIVFRPSKSIPILIEFGERKIGPNKVVGVWVTAVVSLPTAKPLFKFTLFQTGVGLQTPISGGPVFDISFEIDIDIILKNITNSANSDLPNPTISFGYDEPKFPGQFFILLYPQAKGDTAKTLVINFLPTPQLSFGNDPATPADVGTWLIDFALDFMVPMLADIVLDTKFVTNWLNAPVNSTTKVTRGAIPLGWTNKVKTVEQHFLTLAAGKYALNPLFYTGNTNSPLIIVEGIIYNTLRTLLNKQPSFTLFNFDKGKVTISIIRVKNNYGVGLKVDGLSINPKSGKGTEVVFQVGQWMTGGSTKDNWLTASGTSLNGDPAGLNFYLVNDSGGVPSIQKPIIELESIGIDIKGANGAPLFSVKGYDVDGFEIRSFLYLDTGNLSNTQFGFGLRGDNFGMPLGPTSTASGSKTNPVAQNLLSGSKDKKSGKSKTVNPSFSFRSAYSQKFILDFYNAEGDPENEVWIEINKKLGPLDVRQIGAGYIDKKKDVLIGFDGSVSLAGLDLDLQKLTIGIPITHPQDLDDYTLDLQGIDLTFDKGAVDISGGLFKIMPPGSTTPDYDGDIILKAGSLNLAALGAYTVIDKHPSFFMFLTLDVPLGGPEFFFVTGLAAGFGFNRNLILPGQNEVRNFPLVAGAMGGNTFPGGNDPGKALLVMENYIPPDIGEYWLAAGIKFNSFELLNSFALLTVSFGTEFQLALIGISKLAVPSGIPYPIALAELDMEVIFNPSIGILTATAVLNPDSYLLAKDCKLQGGFAFYIYFKDQKSGAKAGSFIVTLGGYNPVFKPKPWFPKEPRLGFNWKVSKEVNIKGGIYFALTTHAIMAGGGLQAVFQAGSLRVWFTVYADFLMYWAPFGYEIDAGITIGASVTLDIFGIKVHLSIELGASVKIQGNPFQGVAKVHVFVFTITVHFGSKDKLAVKPLTWEEFAAQFLPKVSKANAPLTSGTTGNKTNPLLKINISKGLIKKAKTKTGVEYNIVNAKDLSILTDASIPSTALSLNGKALKPTKPVPSISVNPMQQSTLQWKATHDITIVNIENGKKVTFDGIVQTRNLPASLWGQYKAGSVKPVVNPKVNLIKDAPVGTELIPDASVSSHDIGPISLKVLHKDGQLKPKTISRGNLIPRSPKTYSDPVFETIHDSLSDDSIQSVRAAVLAALQKTETLKTDVDVSLYAAYPQTIFRGTPILSRLGDLPKKPD